MCVCVTDRQRQKDREVNYRCLRKYLLFNAVIKCGVCLVCVCVCVCVREREREREKQTDRQTDRQTETERQRG